MEADGGDGFNISGASEDAGTVSAVMSRSCGRVVDESPS